MNIIHNNFRLNQNVFSFYNQAINARWNYHFAGFSSINSVIKMDPKQEQLLEEKCILVDKKDKNIGTASKKECHLIGVDGSPPPLHRAFSVFLFNGSNELLLQQRSSYKITFPLHYTNTCCSHPLSVKKELEETDALGVRIAACRRLNLELGIPESEISPSDFTFLTRIYYSSPSLEGKWGEHEMDYILFLKKDLNLNPDFNEVKEVKYVKLKEFDEFIGNLKKNGVLITPWFQIIVDKFLHQWWSNLDSLDKFVDQKTIHYMS